MSRSVAAEQLQHLGFTELEATIYLSLVAAGAASGYRVAARIGRPVANVYKALQSLGRKGAVVEDDKTHGAVDPAVLIARLEADFASRCRATASALRSLPRAESDAIAVRLHTVDQVVAQARAMLARAKSTVILDAFPRPLELLGPEIAAAAKRVRVVVNAYEATSLAVDTVVVSPDGKRLTEAWKGHWLNLIADGEQALLAFLSTDFTEVQHALHVLSLPLSLLFHSGFVAELRLNALLADLESTVDARGALRRAKKLAGAMSDPATVPGAMALSGGTTARPKPTSRASSPRRRRGSS